ncbi:MAG: ubiquitin-like domain-containing protein [Armatimonadota bacterium]|nr:ubiquitin-like domain-containing protein [Armatimonadota bacterium]MDR7451195.1 ubiquitin-like domain-containing protein [Armatimonadota bacterium]MDR7467200.1 ubiquitin-like domain-containing protein [Armatimonadota bacterium]MDR7494872.1 ubiquitin-like domain-containing protein [Armatimonadota bacterium]MDR7505869.1 ubiquitin-like domain-containing protein [Armatimonadota bacterium]
MVLGLSGAAGAGVARALWRKDVVIVEAGALRHHTTFARTVKEALEEAGVHLQPGDEVSPAPTTALQEGLRIVVRHPVPVTLIADGKTRLVRSAAPTVAELLARRGITLGASDRVFPSRHAPLRPGLRVRVVRIRHEIESEQTVIPVSVAETLAARQGVVRLVPGSTGLRERVWRVTRADGRITSRVLLGWRTVRHPLDRMLSMRVPRPVAARGSAVGREYIDLVATAYAPFCCRGVDDVTALGVQAGYGVVAVDPRVIPLGSRLYIEGYGYAIAADTGSAIKGLRIDLGFDTTREALRFGRRQVRVHIIQRGRPRR